MRKFIIISLFPLFTSSGFAGEKGLFIENMPVRRIVLPENPSKDEENAAKELSQYLGKMTDERFGIEKYSPKMANESGNIFLGKSAIDSGGISKKELSEVENEGYCIRTEKGNVYIAGGKYGGVIYGAYAFLEKAGAKFFAADHQVIPRLGKISIRGLNIKRKPAFELRLLNAYLPLGDSRKYLGHPWQWKGGEEDLRKIGYVGWDHTSAYLVPFLKYSKEHPEYFAKYKDGKMAANVHRKHPHTKIHLCMSNPEVRNIAKERLIKWMDKQKDRLFFTVSQSDGYGWCMCEKCQKLDTVPGKVKTDRLLDFVNDLAQVAKEKHPDKIILTLAYCKDTAPVAKRLKPAENVRVALAAYTPEVADQGHWFDHKRNKKFLPWYEAWVKYIPGQLYIYEYPYANFSSLQFVHEQHYARMKRYAKDGVKGLYFCGRTPFMRSLFDYVTSNLAWDPSLDTRKLTKEFIKSYYGPAAPKMLEIYDYLTKISKPEDKLQGPTIDMKNFVTSKECEKIIKLFDEAEELAKNNPTCLKRVIDDKSFALMTDIQKHNPVRGTAKDMAKFKKRLSELLNSFPGNSKNIFAKRALQKPDKLKDFMWTVARLKLPSGDFKTDPVLKQIMTDPQSVEIQDSSILRKLEPLPNGKGWRIPLELFEGGIGPEDYRYKCPRRRMICIRARLLENHMMRANFKLSEDPGESVLVVEGQDDDKEGATRVRISVNGNEIFRGENKFAELGWSTCSFAVPEGVFKKGDNEILIENMEEGTNPFAQWFMIADVKLMTKKKIAENPKPLLLAHFDKSLNADYAGFPEARSAGAFKVNPNGKWGGALDAGFTNNGIGSLYFNGVSNYNPSVGTLDMWVKLNWKPGVDDAYRTFLRAFVPNHREAGFLLFKYSARKNLSWLRSGSLSGSIANWKPDSWHHLAITWNRKNNTAQMFFDGVLVSRNEKSEISPETATRLFIGCIHNKPIKSRPAGALIDELRILNYVAWEGKKTGEKVFNPPTKPYQIMQK